MFNINRTPEIKEAREKYDRACQHHKEMAKLHRAGAVSSEDLKEAIDDMRQAQNELDAVKRA
ncbi:hypothetical protein [Vibrio sp. Isolate24]|uniref:hypothetical protein n=1 Tax=Vibrio sp. Isolate24 TaxID=2908534 RepID=UPI001EFDB79E|nr:hypothetical protein [Vibrio sp. Isolate24]MCG9679349.1 hypothetical protein [Vibrio sp. Isolate24]